MGPVREKKFIVIGFIVLFIVILVVIYSLNRYQNVLQDYEKTKMLLSKSSRVLGETSDQEIIDKVGKLIELPSGTPSVEKITDKSVFKDQPFFNNSQIGDVVLVFTNAKKVILYRESVNKIVDVGTIVSN